MPDTSLCDICADPVEDGVRRCESCVVEISEQLARMMSEPPTPGDVIAPRRAPAKRDRAATGAASAGVPPPPVGDDEAIRMWELYDEGYAVRTIGRKLKRGAPTVERVLRGLDVWEGSSKPKPPKPKPNAKPKPPKPKRERDMDVLVEQMFYTAAGAQARANIAAALARINIPEEGLGYQGKVAFARSMQHVKASARGAVVQSARQRANDRTGIWRSIIRMDMRRAGLLP